LSFLAETLITQNPFFIAFFFILSYFLIGAAVKFIDDAFDENTFPQAIAFALSPLTAIFWAYIMVLEPASAMILTAIIVGVIVKGKIDNLAFIVAVLCVYAAYFFMDPLAFSFVFLLPIPLIIISIAGILDEIGNDWVDSKNVYHSYKPFGKYIHLFFEFRFIMKIAVLAFALLGFYPIMFFFAFLAWDIGYAVVMLISKSLSTKRKFYYHKTA
jgi:hypothetical protein